jgi:NAD(P)H-dependent FMN reductase
MNAALSMAPNGTDIILFSGMSTLPYYNPDLDSGSPPKEVSALRSLIGSVNGLIISSPEYAHGVPGVLKNTLDWLVAIKEQAEDSPKSHIDSRICITLV